MYALVLSGGGAKGSYQIGVWKALRELNIDVSLVVGTSVGALNGAFFAQQQYEDAINMWSNIDMTSVFEVEDNILNEISKVKEHGIKSINLKLIKHPLVKIFKDRGVDITPLRNTIEELLDEDKIRNSKIDFGLVTISVNDRKPLRLFIEDIPKGELKYYLMGSALVPGFSQDKNDKKRFIDGGVYDNLPVKMAISKDYKDIIVVNLMTFFKNKKYPGINQINISPSGSLGNFLYFNKERSIRNIEMGYLYALKAFNIVKGNKYSFENFPSEKEIIKNLLKISERDLCSISKIILGKEVSNQRALFEKIIPKISKSINLNFKKSYEDFIIGISEYIGKKLELERINKYDFLSYIDEVNSENVKDDSKEKVILIILNSFK